MRAGKPLPTPCHWNAPIIAIAFSVKHAIRLLSIPAPLSD
jgi:hypothetical protein